MAPKKPPPKAANTGKPVDASGLFIECDLPLWESDLSKEDWSNGKGEYNVTGTVATGHFVDPAQEPDPWEIGMVAQHNKDWKRPSAIFSPFKPVVIKMSTPDDPYEGTLEAPHESEQPPPTREDVIAAYRSIRKLKGANPIPGSDNSKRTRGASKRAEARRNQPTPCYMQAFNSCLAVIHHAQKLIPKDDYLWELIYPQAVLSGGIKLPQYNPYGKYVVRVFAQGCWRRVVIDDRLPTDIFGQSLLTVTEVKEIWPALLAKALLKVLGPGKQETLFTNPLWCLWSLLPGYVPQVLDTRMHVSSVLGYFNRMMEQTRRLNDNPEKDEESERFILVAIPRCNGEVSFVGNGLHVNQLYHILEARPLETPPTTMMRVMAPFINWAGEGCYGDKEIWTQEFEAELGFCSADKLCNDNSWNDAWMSWESFHNMFSQVVVLRRTGVKKFSHHKTLHNDGPCATRWLYVKSDHPMQVLMTYSGDNITREGEEPNEEATPLPMPPPDPFRCTVSTYDWKDSLPLKHLLHFEVPSVSTDSFVITMPASEGTAYCIECRGMQKGSIFAVMSESEITWLETQEEILQQHLEVSTWCEVGDVEGHTQDELTVWFKKVINVKQDCTAVFHILDVPLGTPCPTPVMDDTKKGAKKGKEPPPQLALDAAVIARLREEHAAKRIDILSWSRLLVENLDTGMRVYDNVGTISSLPLTPAKNGYLVMAYARAGEDYPMSMYKLTATANTPNLDKGTAIPFKDIITKTGTYTINGSYELFRYNIVPQELCHATLVMQVSCSKDVPYTMEVLRNDEVMWEVTGKGAKYVGKPGPAFGTNIDGGRKGTAPVLVENITLHPTDKTSAAKYSIVCKIGKAFAENVHHAVQQKLKKEFVQKTTKRRNFLERERERMMAAVKAGENPALADEEEVDMGGVAPPDEWVVTYSLKAICSTGKVSFDEDVDTKEKLAELKAGWGKEEKEAKPDAKKGKGIAAPPDERTQKALKARAAYVNNVHGVYLPRVDDVEGKVYVDPEDEPCMRGIPPAEIRVTRSSNLTLFNRDVYNECCGKVTDITEDGVLSITTHAGKELQLTSAEVEVTSDNETLDLGVGSHIVIASKKTVLYSGRRYRVRPPPTPVDDETAIAEWKATEAKISEEREAEEEKLQMKSERKQHRLMFTKSSRQKLLEAHQKQREEYFTAQREAGNLFVVEQVQEEPKKGKKK